MTTSKNIRENEKASTRRRQGRRWVIDKDTAWQEQVTSDITETYNKEHKDSTGKRKGQMEAGDQ